ncbi:MAG TPA: class I tRNA ligase family protein, partial [Acholeplasmataceae bacterium]|nr:class I tRNA ligase family protein [Acholeplasmataceae bacterium]
DGYNPNEHYVTYEERGKLNQLITNKYYVVANDVLDAYENYAFDRVYRNIVPFMTNELSAFYLDYTKDILYIEKENSLVRRSVQSTIFDIALGLLKLLTPIIPHTASEAYQLLPFDHQEDVYLENMPNVYEKIDHDLLKAFDVFEEVRVVVLKKLEEAREQKVIGKSLQAEVDLVVTPKQMEAIHFLDMKINQVLIVSKVNILIGESLSVKVSPAEGVVCDRCWNIVDHVHENGCCDRCSEVIGGK